MAKSYESFFKVNLREWLTTDTEAIAAKQIREAAKKLARKTARSQQAAFFRAINAKPRA